MNLNSPGAHCRSIPHKQGLCHQSRYKCEWVWKSVQLHGSIQCKVMETTHVLHRHWQFFCVSTMRCSLYPILYGVEKAARGGVRKEFGYKIVACLFEAGKKNSLREGMTGNHITILEAGFTHPKLKVHHHGHHLEWEELNRVCLGFPSDPSHQLSVLFSVKACPNV